MDWPTVVVSLAGSAIVGPLSAGLVKYLGDRTIERQKDQFSVGATSHMATVAFDKHIGFCEEYVEEVYKALHALIEGGRTEELLDLRRFSRIRQKWALWLTREIENKLDEFERKIPLMGGAARVFEDNGAPASNEHSITKNIADLREVLHTEELTALRNELVIRSSIKPRHGLKS